MRDDSIQTYTGHGVRPLDLSPEDVCLEDIAHALSMQCRFTGHVSQFYSVAEHSVEVSRLLTRSEQKEHALWGLLHDASEAYLVDVAAPMKQTPGFEAFRDIERSIMEVVCDKFGLLRGEPPQVKWADRRLLATEAKQLMTPLHPDWTNLVEPMKNHTLACLLPAQAKGAFVYAFHMLTDDKWRGRERE